MGKYIFRKIKRGELPKMFQLIAERVRWMDEVGIRQWNVTDYLTVYPMSYYEEMFEQEEICVLEDDASGEILCAAVLKSTDERWEQSELWNDGEPSFYVHNLASKLGCKGTGKAYLVFAEDYARRAGKKYLRLDSAIDNETLTRFYEELGYEAVGECVDGPYLGILRQKKLVEEK